MHEPKTLKTCDSERSLFQFIVLKDAEMQNISVNFICFAYKPLGLSNFVSNNTNKTESNFLFLHG